MKLANLDFIVRNAIKEDHARCDITTQGISAVSKTVSAKIIVKQDTIVCGLPIAQKVFKELDKNIKFQCLCKDGDAVKKDTVILIIKGKAKALLSGERIALNFLGYLCAVAANAHKYVKAVYGLKVKILDTRKTTPGLRDLEKYAVRCGGAVNHRFNLEEMVFIKDNHLLMCHNISLRQLVKNFRKKTDKLIELEVDTLAQFQEALESGADVILLDNMNCEQMKKAVNLRNKMMKNKKPLLEASGGVTLESARKIAQTGVDYISVGALTHSRQSVDVSMELIYA